jgi:hypothetical protein
MADDKEWTTVFYVDDSGHIPVQDFLIFRSADRFLAWLSKEDAKDPLSRD